MSDQLTVLNEVEIEEVNGTLHEYVHAASGAKIFWLETGDTNKFFSVDFQTVPEDNSGVFHILEHSVLCGSKKYPVKNPFLQLAKGSMNTFLNAMTFPDHTSFPVSSRNEKDFYHLVSVYLDAVFCPTIYENKNIFLQEGWHYDILPSGNEAVVNGVVFNEMKGVESAVDTMLHTELMKLLYPDTCYRFVSGGISTEIPKLSYEQFLDTHRRCYRPDNAIIYLEGNLNLEKTFSLMEPYLCAKKEELKLSAIEKQEKVSAGRIEITYPVSAEESKEQSAQIMMGKIVGNHADRKKNFAVSMLAEYLTNSLESPLTQVILSEQIGQDVKMMVDTDLKQPYVMLQIVNTEKQNKTRLKEILYFLKDALISSGCLREELEPILINMEFKYREMEEPRALMHGMDLCAAVAYGESACDGIAFASLFQELKELLDTDYYESVLEELLDPESFSTVVALPVCASDQDECEVVPATDTMVQEYEELMDWQMTPDTIEAVASLPRLELTDIEKRPKEAGCQVLDCDGTKVLLHGAEISDMSYLNLYFPVPKKYEQRLAEVSLLGNLLMNLPTENYDLMTLFQKKNSVMGDLYFEFINTAEIQSVDQSITYFAVHASYLKATAEKAVELIREVLYHTAFLDESYVQNVLLQLADAYRNELIENGHSLGMMQALGSWTSANGATELIEGLSCYEKLKQILEDEKGCFKLLAFMKELTNHLFTKDGLIIGLTVPETDKDSALLLSDYAVLPLLEMIPTGEASEFVMNIKLNQENQVIPIPASVSYATAGAHIAPQSFEEVGTWMVAANIISMDYLWSEIRMKQGAYGAEMKVDKLGNVQFYSFRDPSPEQSIAIMKQCSDYLKEFADSDEPLDPYIIGTISNMEPLVSAHEETAMAEKEYLCGIYYEQLCDIRSGILHTSKRDLRILADQLSKLEKTYTECLIKCL